MTESSHAFKTHVWPEVGPWCREGRSMIVEHSTAKGRLVRDFDTLVGVDVWQLVDDQSSMRSIAARVQERTKNWRTFTVRKSRPSGAETEFAKRLAAIENPREGALYPALTVHAYVQEFRKGPLLSAAMVYTVDLYKYLADQISKGQAKTKLNIADNTEFYYVFWTELAEADIKIFTWPEVQGMPSGTLF